MERIVKSSDMISDEIKNILNSMHITPCSIIYNGKYPFVDQSDGFFTVSLYDVAKYDYNINLSLMDYSNGSYSVGDSGVIGNKCRYIIEYKNKDYCIVIDFISEDINSVILKARIFDKDELILEFTYQLYEQLYVPDIVNGFVGMVYKQKERETTDEEFDAVFLTETIFDILNHFKTCQEMFERDFFDIVVTWIYDNGMNLKIDSEGKPTEFILN